ncbi:MAG: TIGR02301 family protein [Rhodoblastus sp.]|nr:TIGR02301 family protein [Rhodoblastus sp.]
MSRASRAILCALALALAATPATAVERKPARPSAAAKAPEKKPEPPPEPTPGVPLYENQLLRLSEIMGALAYLRDLCGDGDGAEYRAKMAALLDAEGTAPERREKLAGAYNRGYRGYETTYGQCTANARAAITRFVAEGGRLARDISDRYGGA